MEFLRDRFDREFPYLRLSITDVCNFHCIYCLPNGYQKTFGATFLTIPEIERLVRAFVELGTWKVRLTGGEPTLRPDFIMIAKAISAIQGIRKIAFTTNGYKLKENTKAYVDAGLSGINISIDSLDPGTFFKVTGHNRLQEVLDGVDAALSAGFSTIKINKVFLKDVNHEDIEMFLHFIQERPVSVRLIELMQTSENQDFFRQHHISTSQIRQRLHKAGWAEKKRDEGAGPAIELFHKDYQGTIGIIAPYSKGFCATCNRLRVTARGELRLCLFGDKGYSLRSLLQEDHQKNDLVKEIKKLISFKKETHFLAQGNTGITPHLAALGG